MPSPGIIELLYEPGGPGIRVDTGVSKGYEVPVFYDPMIAKLITWGRSREQALRRMRRALRHYKILGLHNNIPFLLAIILHKKFREGDLHTGFLDENADLFEQQPKQHADLAGVVAAILDYQGRRAGRTANGRAANGKASTWKLGARAESWDRPWR
jgi:acetyl/propionyl-CoA carboxylase alpha subunit